MADPIASDADVQALFGMAPPAPVQPQSVPIGPVTAPAAPATAADAAQLFAPPPPDATAQRLTQPQRAPGFLNNTWHSILGLGSDVLDELRGGVLDASAGAARPDASAVVPPEMADVPGYVPPKVVADFGKDPGPFVAGMVRGVRDVIDKPAQMLASVAGQGDQIAAKNAADRKAFDEQHADSTKASIGRAIGQTAAIAPLASTGAGLLGEAGGAVASAAPTLGRIAASPLGRVAANVATGAGIGAGTGALTAKPGEEGEGAASGAEFGAVAGPLTSGALALGRGAVNAVTGVSANVADNIANLVRKAQTYGINPEAFQLSPNLLTRIGGEYLGMFPFSGRTAALADNVKNWRTAVAKTMGANSDSLNPVTMSDTADRLRNVFQSAAPQISMPMDQAMLSDLTSVQQQAQRYWADPAGMQKLNNLVDDVWNAHYADPSKPGVMSGQQYLSLTNQGSPLDRATSAQNDPDLRYFAGQIRSALDSSLSRHAPADVQDQINTARSQWRAMKTVEDALGVSGDLEPGRLFQSALNHSRRFDPSTGGLAYQPTELGDLGRIGSLFLAPQRSSGTTEKATAAGAIGTLGGLMVHNPLAAAPYAAAVGTGLTANRALQSYLRSPWLTGRMITPPPAMAPTRNALPYAVPFEQGLLGNAGNQ